MSDVVEEVKKTSSRWIKTQGAEFTLFKWQGGYGAFAVSTLHVPAVCEYINGQREHHQRQEFPQEYLQFLAEHGLSFDERYVWD